MKTMEKNAKKVCLDGKWDLYFAENKDCKAFAESIVSAKELKKHKLTKIEGTVPGNVELDLSAAGLLPRDLYFGTNIWEVQKIENYHFWYNATFKNEFSGECYFEFSGLDTFADIYLNGEKIYSAENMLISHTVKAENLKKGLNEILVHFKPTNIESRKEILEAGISNTLMYNASSVSVRKAAHMYGWDIMPRAVSAGIYKSVYLYEKPEIALQDVYVHTRFLKYEREMVGDGRIGALSVYYRFTTEDDSLNGYKVTMDLTCKDKTIHFESTPRHTEEFDRIFLEEEPYLWWPRGMGEPNLYRGSMILYKDGEKVSEKEVSLGIRRVDLKLRAHKSAEDTGEFQFYVNGEKMFVHGTNWVPLDAFHSQDKKRLKEILNHAVDLNCNMIRLWGGNVYEDEELYKFCDENGIAIWQDFGMACTNYPRTDSFQEKIKKELYNIVPVYRKHASLFLWAGDNECDLAAAWCLTSLNDPNRNIITRRTIPDVLSCLDPTRIFLPSSPYYSPENMASENPYLLSEDHLWGPRGYYKDEYYAGMPAHFASEMGYHGCSNLESMKKFLPEDALWPWQDNKYWNCHAASMEEDCFYNYRIPLMANQIKNVFTEEPKNLDEFITLSQIVQSEAYKYFIELFRTNMHESRTGIIWWSLTDGWPQFADSVVDYYGSKKIAYETIKRVQKDVAVMFKEPEKGKFNIIASNCTLKESTVSVKITDLTEEKEVFTAENVALAKNCNTLLGTVKEPKEPHFYLIEYEANGEKQINHYLSGKPHYSAAEIIGYYKKAGLLK